MPTPIVPRVVSIRMLQVVALKCAALAGWSASAVAAPVPYFFNVNSPSGLSTTSASVQAKTTGNLIGNWDAAANPTGTRTTPGLFGSFGDTENVAVPATVNLSTGGMPTIPLAGSFAMSIDTRTNSIIMSKYMSSMSSAATGSLATSATFTTQSFRTRNPSSTFPGGIPVTQSIGDASITSLSIVQAAPAPGTLTRTGANQFTFSLTPTFDVTLGVNLSGSEMLLGPVSTSLLFEGTFTLNGRRATVSSMAGINIQQTDNPAEALPPLPFALPTVLPPGGTANVIFNLTLDQVITSIQGQLSTQGTGGIGLPALQGPSIHPTTFARSVPEPSAALGLIAALASVGAMRFRRR